MNPLKGWSWWDTFSLFVSTVTAFAVSNMVVGPYPVKAPKASPIQVRWTYGDRAVIEGGPDVFVKDRFELERRLAYDDLIARLRRKAGTDAELLDLLDRFESRAVPGRNGTNGDRTYFVPLGSGTPPPDAVPVEVVIGHDGEEPREEYAFIYDAREGFAYSPQVSTEESLLCADAFGTIRAWTMVNPATPSEELQLAWNKANALTLALIDRWSAGRFLAEAHRLAQGPEGHRLPLKDVTLRLATSEALRAAGRRVWETEPANAKDDMVRNEYLLLALLLSQMGDDDQAVAVAFAIAQSMASNYRDGVAFEEGRQYLLTLESKAD